MTSDRRALVQETSLRTSVKVIVQTVSNSNNKITEILAWWYRNQFIDIGTKSLVINGGVIEQIDCPAEIHFWPSVWPNHKEAVFCFVDGCKLPGSRPSQDFKHKERGRWWSLLMSRKDHTCTMQLKIAFFRRGKMSGYEQFVDSNVFEKFRIAQLVASNRGCVLLLRKHFTGKLRSVNVPFVLLPRISQPLCAWAAFQKGKQSALFQGSRFAEIGYFMFPCRAQGQWSRNSSFNAFHLGFAA